MTVVAVGADCGVDVAESDRLSMNTLPVRQKRPVADSASLHHGSIAVTPATSLSNVRAVDCRLRIAGRQECRQVAVSRMAIQTLRTLRPVSFRKRMEALVILTMPGGVEQGTTKIWQCLTGAVTGVTLEVWLGCGLIPIIGFERRGGGCRPRSCRRLGLRIRTINKLEKAAEQQHK